MTKLGFLVRRASPEGQSFRSLGEETPPELMMKRDWKKSGGEEDSDDDYENVSRTARYLKIVSSQSCCLHVFSYILLSF